MSDCELRACGSLNHCSLILFLWLAAASISSDLLTVDAWWWATGRYVVERSVQLLLQRVFDRHGASGRHRFTAFIHFRFGDFSEPRKVMRQSDT